LGEDVRWIIWLKRKEKNGKVADSVSSVNKINICQKKKYSGFLVYYGVD